MGIHDGTVADNGGGWKEESRSVNVADDLLKNAARNGSFGNDSECGEGTTVVLKKKSGVVRRRMSDEEQSER